MRKGGRERLGESKKKDMNTARGETVEVEIEEEVVQRDGGWLDGLKGGLLSQREREVNRDEGMDEWNVS